MSIDVGNTPNYSTKQSGDAHGEVISVINGGAEVAGGWTFRSQQIGTKICHLKKRAFLAPKSRTPSNHPLTLITVHPVLQKN